MSPNKTKKEKSPSAKSTPKSKRKSSTTNSTFSTPINKSNNLENIQTPSSSLRKSKKRKNIANKVTEPGSPNASTPINSPRSNSPQVNQLPNMDDSPSIKKRKSLSKQSTPRSAKKNNNNPLMKALTSGESPKKTPLKHKQKAEEKIKEVRPKLIIPLIPLSKKEETVSEVTSTSSKETGSPPFMKQSIITIPKINRNVKEGEKSQVLNLISKDLKDVEENDKENQVNQNNSFKKGELLDMEVQKEKTILSPPKSKPKPILLSPLKSEIRFMDPPKNVLSTPNGGKKKVVFMDSIEGRVIESAVPSPTKSDTPLRSILKVPEGYQSPVKEKNGSPTKFNANTTVPQTYDVESWQPGSIVQVESESEEVTNLLDSCVNLLKDEKCERKFEVYASLNLLAQNNPSSFLLKKLVNNIEPLIEFIRRDILICETNIEKKSLEKNDPTLSPMKASDPFENRVIIQAIKLTSFFTSRLEFISILKPQDIIFIFDHISENVSINRDKIPKSVGAAYMMLIKDQKLSCFQSLNLAAQKKIHDQATNDINNSQSSILPLLLQGFQRATNLQKDQRNKYSEKKYFISVESSERLLNAILKIQGYNSVSMSIERSVAIRNMISEFPTTMEKHFNHWIGTIMLNLVIGSRIKSLSGKILGVSIAVILEMTKVYLDNSALKLKFHQFLHSKVIKEQGSKLTLGSLDESESISLTNNSTGNTKRLLIHQIIINLTRLVECGQYKLAMDAWLCITILICHGRTGSSNGIISKFEITKWEYLSDWMFIFDLCMNSNHVEAIVVALKAYKCIILVNGEIIRDNLKVKPTEIDSQTGVLNEKAATERFNENCQSSIELLLRPLSKVNHKCFNSDSVVMALHQVCLKIVYVAFNNLSTDTPNFNINNNGNNNSSLVSVQTSTANIGKLHTIFCRELWVIIDTLLNKFYLALLEQHGLDKAGAFHEFYTALLSIKQKTSNNLSVYSTYKVLSQDQQNLRSSDIKSVSSRWIFNNFDKVSPMITKIVNARKDTAVLKFDFLTKFLQSIKSVIKKDKELTTTGYETLGEITGIIGVFANSLTTKNELVECGIPLSTEYLDMFHSNDLGNLQFINEVLSKLTDIDSQAGTSQLKTIVNSLPTAKQLQLFRELSKTGQSSIQQFIVTNLESRIFSNFTYNNCLIIASIISNHNLKKLDVEKMIKKLVDQLIRLPRMNEDLIKKVFFVLKLTKIIDFEAFLKSTLQFRKFHSTPIDSSIILEILTKITDTKDTSTKLQFYKTLISYELFPDALHETCCEFLQETNNNMESIEIYQGFLKLLLRIGDYKLLNKMLKFGINSKAYHDCTMKFVDDNNELVKDETIFDFHKKDIYNTEETVPDKLNDDEVIMEKIQNINENENIIETATDKMYKTENYQRENDNEEIEIPETLKDYVELEEANIDNVEIIAEVIIDNKETTEIIEETSKKTEVIVSKTEDGNKKLDEKNIESDKIEETIIDNQAKHITVENIDNKIGDISTDDSLDITNGKDDDDADIIPINVEEYEDSFKETEEDVTVDENDLNITIVDNKNFNAPISDNKVDPVPETAVDEKIIIKTIKDTEKIDNREEEKNDADNDNPETTNSETQADKIEPTEVDESINQNVKDDLNNNKANIELNSTTIVTTPTKSSISNNNTPITSNNNTPTNSSNSAVLDTPNIESTTEEPKVKIEGLSPCVYPISDDDKGTEIHPEIVGDSDEDEFLDAQDYPNSPTLGKKRRLSDDDRPEEPKKQLKPNPVNLFVENFKTLVDSVSHENLNNLTIDEKFQLETSLLEFMLKLRKR